MKSTRLYILYIYRYIYFKKTGFVGGPPFVLLDCRPVQACMSPPPLCSPFSPRGKMAPRDSSSRSARRRTPSKHRKRESKRSRSPKRDPPEKKQELPGDLAADREKAADAPQGGTEGDEKSRSLKPNEPSEKPVLAGICPHCKQEKNTDSGMAWHQWTSITCLTYQTWHNMKEQTTKTWYEAKAIAQQVKKSRENVPAPKAGASGGKRNRDAAQGAEQAAEVSQKNRGNAWGYGDQRRRRTDHRSSWMDPRDHEGFSASGGHGRQPSGRYVQDRGEGRGHLEERLRLRDRFGRRGDSKKSSTRTRAGITSICSIELFPRELQQASSWMGLRKCFASFSSPAKAAR